MQKERKKSQLRTNFNVKNREEEQKGILFYQNE